MTLKEFMSNKDFCGKVVFADNVLSEDVRGKELRIVVKGGDEEFSFSLQDDTVGHEVVDCVYYLRGKFGEATVRVLADESGFNYIAELDEVVELNYVIALIQLFAKQGSIDLNKTTMMKVIMSYAIEAFREAKNVIHMSF